MGQQLEVRWEGDLPATPQEVWDAITVHTAGWLWQIDDEPWVGGSERGLTPGGGTVTAWVPPRHVATRADGDGDDANELDDVLEPRGTGTHVHDADAPAGEQAWSAWLDGVFATEAVA
jgi:uncharacterized protein YndB with AHSA1/START domain